MSHVETQGVHHLPAEQVTTFSIGYKAAPSRLLAPPPRPGRRCAYAPGWSLNSRSAGAKITDHSVGARTVRENSLAIKCQIFEDQAG